MISPAPATPIVWVPEFCLPLLVTFDKNPNYHRAPRAQGFPVMPLRPSRSQLPNPCLALALRSPLTNHGPNLK